MKRSLAWWFGSASALLIGSCGGHTSSGPSNSPTNAPDGSGPDGDTGDDQTVPEDSGIAEGGSCTIDGNRYDQSCSVDSDCVAYAGGFPVQFGDWCGAGCLCGGGVINASAAAQFVSDVSRTPLGSGPPPNCSCPAYSGSPCCERGRCKRFGCSTAADDGGVEGGIKTLDSGIPDGSVLCAFNEGPLDANVPDAGPTRWCVPGQTCLPFNGAWACCSNPQSIAFCVPAR